MTDSQDWWPADWGHYGGLMIRMAWHAAGTYRIADGRGGGGHRQPAFRAAQLLAGQRQPRQGPPPAVADQEEVRQQAQLGRPDRPGRHHRLRVDGPEDLRLRLRPRRHLASRERTPTGAPKRNGWPPAAATAAAIPARRSGEPARRREMGLIYVNPEGVDGKPDPLKTAQDVRVTFARMAMNDEETVALTAGGHTVGKCHGNGRRRQPGPEPRRRRARRAGPRLEQPHRRGIGRDTVTSGLEGAWTTHPTQWDNGYFDLLLQVRLGTEEEPRRRLAVGADQHQGRRQAGRRRRPVDPPQPDHDRRRHGDEMDPNIARSPSASTRTRPTSPRSSPAPGSS
jgi:catalase-peroxidase